MDYYTFKRGSRLFIDGIEVVHLQDYSFSQTISERTITRDSLFKSVKTEGIINRRRNVGNGSFAFYLSGDTCFEYVLSLMGFDFRQNFTNSFDPSSSVVQVITDDVTFTLSNVELTSLDIPLQPSGMGLVTVSFEFAKMQRDPLYQIKHSPIDLLPIRNSRYFKCTLADQQEVPTTSGTISITKEVDWKYNGASHFNLGEITESSRPTISQGHVVANVNTYFKAPKYFSEAFTEDITLETATYLFHIPNARITTRTEPGQVFTTALDIKHQDVNLPLSFRRK